MKKPRASPWTAGFTRTGPSSFVASCSMRGGSLDDRLGSLGDHARDRQRRGGAGGRRVAHVQRAVGRGEDEVIDEPAVARERLGTDAGGAIDDVSRAQLRDEAR